MAISSHSNLRRISVKCTIAAIFLTAVVSGHAQKMPSVNSPAPNFGLTDLFGQRHELKEFQGAPSLLCFFCGCEPCHRFARAWGLAQRSGGVASVPTIVVFDGERDALHAFSVETNMELNKTVPLADPLADVARKYDALPCPRLFVLDGRGMVRYVNNHSDDEPQKAPAAALVSKVVTALGSLTTAAQETTNSPIVSIESLATAMPYRIVQDLGKIDRVLTPKLERIIRLKNATSEPIAIEKLQSTCACVASLLPPSVKESGNLMQPGGGIDVRISLDMRGLPPGLLEKQIWVYAKGKPSAIASIDLKMTLSPTVEFSVSQLDFSRLAAGTSRSMTITASVDRRLMADGWPQLVCTHPDVQISQSNPTDDAGQAKRRCMYTVTVPSNTRLGSLNGRLGFPSGSARGNGKEAEDTVFLGGAAVTILGEMTGPISASPTAMVFGTLSPGLEQNKTVVVTGQDAKALEGLTVSCANSYLLTHLSAPETAPTAANAGAFALALTVRLLKTRPLGALETEVTLTNPKGIRLVIPIIAFTPAGGL